MKHDFFRAFQGGHGPGLAMDFVSTVGVCAFSERMEEGAGPIFRRCPRLEVGRLLRPQRKASSTCTLLDLSNQTGRSRTHTFWKNEGGSQFLSGIPWGEAASCVSNV